MSTAPAARMAEPGDRAARVALNRLGEPGDPRLARLVAELGPGRVLDVLSGERDPTGMATEVALRLEGLDPQAELERAAARGIRFVCPGDQEWPDQLDALGDVEPVAGRGGAPLGLWVRGPGRLDELALDAIAVVGSRSATSYGAGVAGELAAGLAGTGTTVVSGAAFGIDQAAHRGALAADGPTLAVLACGVDRAYPTAHRALLDYIADTGVLVSETAPGGSPTKLRFLSRNRVIAGLGRGTVVVEAALRSGALNTANWALQLGRTVMGVPGPVTSAPSQGVHELIRCKGASLVTRAEDVRDLVSPLGEAAAPMLRGADRAHDRLSLPDQRLLDSVPVLQAVSMDGLARTAGLSAAQVRDGLDRLRRLGLVEGRAGTWRLAPRD